MCLYKAVLFEKIVYNKKGISLLNLMVALGVLALLITIALPNIRAYQPNLKLNATARNMAIDLRYAQQLTVTEQEVHRVNFDISKDKYVIEKIGAATTTVKTVEFDSEVNFQQITGLTDDRVVFNYYGGVSESGQIILININAKTATINVKPSGYIQLE